MDSRIRDSGLIDMHMFLNIISIITTYVTVTIMFKVFINIIQTKMQFAF